MRALQVLRIASLLTCWPLERALPTATAAASESMSSSQQQPNVLMVVLDDVGWQDVGFHDDSFHTPHINRLASEGVELMAFYTSQECTPARSQLMTGRYNYKVGMQDSVIRSTEPRGVPLENTLLPEKLLGAGYQTAMVGKWHLGFHMSAYTPNERGFERHYGIYLGGGDHFTHLSDSKSAEARLDDTDLDTRYYTGPNLVEDGETSEDNELTHAHSSELYTNKSLAYLEDMVEVDDPWFLYLSYQAVHSPVEVNEEWYEDNSCAGITSKTGQEEFPLASDDVSWSTRRKICGMMAQVDHGLGLIRTYLEEVGQWDDTVVLLFSDNGGVTDYGSLNLPYRGEKGEYWEGGVRVPAVIAGGYTVSSLEAGLGSSYNYRHMVHITDMHATALALAGVDDGPSSADSSALSATAASGATSADASTRTNISTSTSTSTSTATGELDGVDLWDAITNTAEAVRHTIILNVNSPLFASSGSVRHGRYKLTRNPEPKETLIYNKVRSALADYGFFVPQAVLAIIASDVHADLGLDDGGHMFLIDLDLNPYERTTCPDGGNHPACSNLYHHEAYADVREELEAIMETAQDEALHSTFQWQDDGPLSDPFNFGGWLPWRDDKGYPRAQYGGAYVPSSEREATGPSYDTSAAVWRQIPSPLAGAANEGVMSAVFNHRNGGNSSRSSFDGGRRPNHHPGNSSHSSFDGGRRPNHHPGSDEPRIRYSRGADGGKHVRAEPRPPPVALSVKPFKGLDGVVAKSRGSGSGSSSSGSASDRNRGVPEEQQDLYAAAAAAAANAARAAVAAADAVTAAEIAADDSAAASTSGSATPIRPTADNHTRARLTNELGRQYPPVEMAAVTADPPEEGFENLLLYSVAEVCGVVAAGATVVVLAVALVTAIKGGPKVGYVRLRN